MSRDWLQARFADAGLDARTWSNQPGHRYGLHAHGYHKILYCVDGAITFHLRDGDVALEAGDRLDIEPDTDHAATVHDRGVTCIEAPADGPEDLPATG